MCFDAGARPPLPPMAGGALDAHDVVLVSADGTRLAAFAARAAAPTDAGIVVVPDVRGLQPYYAELAQRFAEAGAHAVAVDLYARTAGASRRDERFEHEPHVRAIQRESVRDDVAAAIAYLRSPEGGGAARIFAIGFCIGGRVSLMQAAEGQELAGVIGFYGWPVGEHRTGYPAPADFAVQFHCPVLALYGGADRGIGPDAVQAFDAALESAGVPHESVVYEGAPHSFFDRRQAEFADASADAWRRVLEFMGLDPAGDAGSAPPAAAG